MDLSYFILVFATVFFVTDSIGNLPIFLGLTHRYPTKERHQLIGKSHIVAMIAFFLFSIFGLALLSFLGIDLFSLKIAGGFLLFTIGLEMIYGFKTRTETSPNEQEEAEEKENLAITPLGIPLITGPGAIITGIVLFARATTPLLQAQFTIATVLAFALGLIIFLQAEQISNRFGKIGMKVSTRIMGLLLMALAVQFVINGIKDAGIF